MNLDELTGEIKTTKKYSSLYPPLINRICSEEFSKHKKDKEKIKAVKNRLHMIYGAFFYKNKNNLDSLNLSDSSDLSNISNINETEILNLNVSAKERLPSIDEFYKFIFDSINANENEFGESQNKNKINSILDIACGFNPFSLPFMQRACPLLLPNLKYYCALDIDLQLAEILNKYFSLKGLPELAGCTDIISDFPNLPNFPDFPVFPANANPVNPGQKTDVAFLFKIIPTIENCKKGRAFELMEQIRAKYIIATFPVKTLCGKDKGMAENYAVSFERNINNNKFVTLAKNIIGNELIYVLAVK